MTNLLLAVCHETYQWQQCLDQIHQVYHVAISDIQPIDVHVVSNDSPLQTSTVIGAVLAGLVGIGSFLVQSMIQEYRQRKKDTKAFRSKLSLLHTELTQFGQAIIQPEDFLYWGAIEMNSWNLVRPLLSPFSAPTRRNAAYGHEAQLVQIVDDIYIFSRKVNTLIDFYRRNPTQSYIEDKLRDLLSWEQVYQWQEQVRRAHELIHTVVVR